MNEIGLLKILYKHKIRILMITLAVGIITGGITLLSHNKYSSTAAISVQPPEVPLTGEIPPLSVETLRSLIESTRVKWELFQELRGEEVLSKNIDFLRFQEMLTTLVNRDQSQEKLLLPMIKLTATTHDPDLSMVIANRWAALVLKNTKAIYQSGVDELSVFTTNISDQVTRSLLESEEEYTKTMLESNLTINKMLFEQNEELYSRLSKEVLTLQEEVATRSALLKELKEKLGEQEINEIWVGEVFAREFTEDATYALPVSSELSSRIARTIRSLKSNELAEAEFNAASQLDHKYQMRDIKKQQIEAISGEISTARGTLSGMEPTYKKLKEELESIEPKIVLSKAMGDDKLWEAYAGGELKSSAAMPTMKTESSNPIYEETMKEMVSLAGQVNGLRSTISSGEDEIEKLRKEIAELIRESAPLTSKRTELRSAMEKDRELLTYYGESYNQDRKGYEVGEKELAEIEVKLMAKKAKLDAVGKEIADLEDKVFSSTNQIARQERKVKNLAEVSASLSAQAEKVALLRISIENVSRSGTVLLYKAQADPVKVGPPRTKIVLISMLMAFVLVCLLVVLNVLVREG